MTNNYQGFVSSDKVYVRDYKRDDGTAVSSYYRAKPGFGITNPNVGINSNVTLQGGISYDDIQSTIPWNTPLSMMNSPYLFGQGGILTEINNRMNSRYQDAADLMNFSIWGTKNMPQSNYHKVIDSSFNDKLSSEFDVDIPKGWNGVVFSNDSSIATNIANNPEFIGAVGQQMAQGLKNKKFDITFSPGNDPNLFRSIHNATVLNPHIDNQGNFNAIVYDKYDFDWIKGNAYQNPIVGTNNAAYVLQQLNRLENYYVLIPVKIKL